MEFVSVIMAILQSMVFAKNSPVPISTMSTIPSPELVNVKDLFHGLEVVVNTSKVVERTSIGVGLTANVTMDM